MDNLGIEIGLKQFHIRFCICIFEKKIQKFINHKFQEINWKDYILTNFWARILIYWCGPYSSWILIGKTVSAILNELSEKFKGFLIHILSANITVEQLFQNVQSNSLSFWCFEFTNFWEDSC